MGHASNSRINDVDQHRSKEFTTEYILLLNKQKNAVNSTEYLKNGDLTLTLHLCFKSHHAKMGYIVTGKRRF